MSQPKWKRVYSTDYSQLWEDETGVYEPELEIAQEFEEEDYDDEDKVRFIVYRFPLDRLKVVEGYLVPDAYDPDTYPHPLPQYQEWFAKDLKSVASSAGTSVKQLVKDLTSADIKARARAYEDIGGHFGFENFDGYPVQLSEPQLNKRWE